jgi:hypothetical protein
MNPETHPWPLPTIRERLLEEVLEPATAAEADDGKTLGTLRRWIDGLATLDPSGNPVREALRQELQRGRFSLDLLGGSGG